ncbi:EamA family transporter [Maritimibacter sp. DP1N21-5]|uniref:EamA family transporter n=1 Tax=Maritimibacter sp. DP1N21-5 TaxID=2836867 RepID=UPI001C449FBA|nr:EamA family transporter [Maritimibacter sp. DP1N21-5]MBV7410914.1 EamA family transporter [Maritimibacter sp. DP1N21-5]
MSRLTDTLITALTPIIWGTTYITTTQFLPEGYPMHAALLRSLPAGLILLVVTRNLPPRDWLGRIAVLGVLNFSLFFVALFIAAYRLPGGVAATVGAIQPLIVLVFARLALGTVLRPASVAAAIAGLVGVGMLVLGPDAQLDPVGVAAALLGALSMGAGVVLARRWQPPVSPLTFTAWQLTAGGIFLLPATLIMEPALPALTMSNLAGYLWLGVVGGALAYFLWFRGIARLDPAGVTGLGFLSPLSAILIGWVVLSEALTPVQIVGAIVILASVWASSRAARPSQAPLSVRQ